MKVVLHIGANKTGTSAIQAHFNDNRKALLEHGVLWPKTGKTRSAHYGLSDLLGFGLSRKYEPSDRELLDLQRNFFAEIEAADPSTVVLSSEMFMRQRSLSYVNRFFQGCDLDVVVFLRRHDTWLPSLWGQAIKTVDNPPWGRSFESFMEFQLTKTGQFFNFRKLTEVWQTGCTGNFRAVPYEQSFQPEGIIPAFLDAIGLGHLSDKVPVKHLVRNVSPRINVLSLIDFLKRIKNIDPDFKARLLREIMSKETSGRTVSQFISAHTKRNLIARYAEDYAYLSEQFCPPGQADFFREPIPEDDNRGGPHHLPPVQAVELLLQHLR